ncbi:MAG: hypothetical protein JWM82_4054 [Myxococcales bacterium]|nr:hypothetical protein [Myxococcales bacterium]
MLGAAAAKAATASTGVETMAVAEIALHGTGPETVALEDILRDLLAGRASVTMTRVDRVDAGKVIEPALPVRAGDAVVARAWIELEDGDRVTVYVVDRAWERILVRHLERGDSPREIVLESTARVVATAVEALIQGARIGVAREEIARPAPPPPVVVVAPAPPPTPVTVDLGAFYGAELFSDKVAVLHGPGISFGRTTGARRIRPGATLTGQLWLPTTTTDASVGLRLLSGSLRLLATVNTAAGRHTTLTAGLGGGVDLTRVEPETVGAASVGVSPRAETALTTAMARAVFGASFRLPWGFGVSVMASLDVDLSDTRYVLSKDGAAVDFLRPRMMRPGLMVGVTRP